MNEKQIITLVQGGHTDRYADLVERYQIGLIIYCERLVHDRMEAEDVAQKSFIKASDTWPTYGQNKEWRDRIVSPRSPGTPFCTHGERRGVAATAPLHLSL